MVYSGKKQYRKSSRKRSGPKSNNSSLRVGIIFFFIGSILGGIFIYAFYPLIFYPENYSPYCVSSGKFKLPPSDLTYVSRNQIIRENNGTIDDLKFYDGDIINLTINPNPSPVEIHFDFQLSWLVKNISNINALSFILKMKLNKSSDFVTRVSYVNKSGDNLITLRDLHSNGDINWIKYKVNLYPNRTKLANKFFLSPYGNSFTIALQLPQTSSLNDYNIQIDSCYAEIKAKNIDCELYKQLYDSDYF